MDERAAVVQFLRGYVTRLRTGPRSRAVSPIQLDKAEAIQCATLIEGLCGSIEAGLHRTDD